MMSLTLIVFMNIYREEVKSMKKSLSNKTLLKEASFWDGLKRVVKDNPGKACHK